MPGKSIELEAEGETPQFIIPGDASGRVSHVTDGILGAGLGGERFKGSAYFVILHKVHEGRALNLHRLSLPVVERQDKMKEVGFPQVRRRLLFKVGPGQGNTAAQEVVGGEREKDSVLGSH